MCQYYSSIYVDVIVTSNLHNYEALSVFKPNFFHFSVILQYFIEDLCYSNSTYLMQRIYNLAICKLYDGSEVLYP